MYFKDYIVWKKSEVKNVNYLINYTCTRFFYFFIHHSSLIKINGKSNNLTPEACTYATRTAYDHKQTVQQILGESVSSWLINQILGKPFNNRNSSFIAGASQMTTQGVFKRTFPLPVSYLLPTRLMTNTLKRLKTTRDNGSHTVGLNLDYATCKGYTSMMQ